MVAEALNYATSLVVVPVTELRELLADKDRRASSWIKPDSDPEIELDGAAEIRRLCGEIRQGLVRAKSVTRVDFPAKIQTIATERLDEAEMLTEVKDWAGARRLLILVALWARKGITLHGQKTAVHS